MYAPRIAFIGKMGAGKTTAAEYLFNRGDLPYNLIRFAAPLKRIAVEIFGEGSDTDRELLQWLGTDVVRARDTDAWARITGVTIDDLGDGSAIVIDDCRFPNEYAVLRERGFTFCRIVAEEALRIDRLQKIGKLTDLDQLQHASEIALDDIQADQTIENNHDDFDAFYTEVNRVVQREVARA